MILYCKILFWGAQGDGCKLFLHYEKRHMLDAATFHLAYSVPGCFLVEDAAPRSFLNSQGAIRSVLCSMCSTELVGVQFYNAPHGDKLTARPVILNFCALTLDTPSCSRVESLLLWQETPYRKVFLIQEAGVNSFRRFHRRTSTLPLLCILQTTVCFGCFAPDMRH